jgi:hypothetical protein
VSAVLPTALLPVAGVMALVMVWPRLQKQPSNGRLFAEAVGMTLVAIALVWTAWVVLWLVEQRW